MRAVKLAELLSARLVAAELAATTKAGALDELAQRLSELARRLSELAQRLSDLAQRVNDLAGGGAGQGLGLPGRPLKERTLKERILKERTLKERILHVLLDRERLGHGVALPHGRLPGLEGFLLGLGRSRPGVDFDADDGEPAHLVALLVSPEGTTRHLLALAGLARLLCATGCSPRPRQRRWKTSCWPPWRRSSRPQIKRPSAAPALIQRPAAYFFIRLMRSARHSGPRLSRPRGRAESIRRLAACDGAPSLEAAVIARGGSPPRALHLDIFERPE